MTITMPGGRRTRKPLPFTRLIFLLFALLLPIVAGCSPKNACNDPSIPGSCTRVLFIGNSYTYVNDLPATFASLANTGGHAVETGMLASGGWTLAQHVQDSATASTLASRSWTYVVLQEQSEIPAIAGSRESGMYPAARTLTAEIRNAGATPVFYLTWGHQNGLPNSGLPDYENMQSELDTGYLGIAGELNVPIAPVGYAWWQARNWNPQVSLWQSDGSHPNSAGTYLAACVFYATLFRQSPEGIPFTAGLSGETAAFLQKTAASVVLGNPAQWYIQ